MAWVGYPAWYWVATGAGLAAMALGTLLSDWWGLVGVAVVAVALVGLVRVVSRIRGVCEGWTRSAMRWRDGVVLYGPAMVVLTANGIASRAVWWSPVVAAVLVFAAFAGAGLTLSARAARR